MDRVHQPRQVAAAVRRIETDPAYRARTQELAAKMSLEDGAGAVVAAVESVV